jgi:CRP/FNR family cyclic AMP-dependent transcriptional regulator
MNVQCERTVACESCRLKDSGFLCHLTPVAAREFESIKSSSFYPSGSTLFLENEPAKGIYLLCSGKVKLSVSSRGGKTLILQLARPGEILERIHVWRALRGQRRNASSIQGSVYQP